MVKSISTLIPDIYSLVKTKGGWFHGEISEEFSHACARRLEQQFQVKKAPTLRLSQMGPKCPCALWHSIHTPAEAEPLPAWAEIKYSYGHIIEAWAIALAKAAGHRVEGEQDELRVDGIVGHRDCVIDGCLVDVKSSSSYGMAKFKDGSIREDDAFGYLDQLDGYLIGSLDDPLVQVKDKAYLFAVDKQLGHMVLYRHESTPQRQSRLIKRIELYKSIVRLPSSPKCTCETTSDGKSGNIKLGVKAAYNPYKYCCFPNLRTFIYAKGPVYLTHVERRPDPTILEVDRYGKFIHA